MCTVAGGRAGGGVKRLFVVAMTQHICIRKAPSLNLDRNTRYPWRSVVFASSDKRMPGNHTKKHRYTFLPQRDLYLRSLFLMRILRILNRTATHKATLFCKFILFKYFADRSMLPYCYYDILLSDSATVHCTHTKIYISHDWVFLETVAPPKWR
jgi:hypothetical protein